MRKKIVFKVQSDAKDGSVTLFIDIDGVVSEIVFDRYKHNTNTGETAKGLTIVIKDNDNIMKKLSPNESIIVYRIASYVIRRKSVDLPIILNSESSNKYLALS